MRKTTVTVENGSRHSVTFSAPTIEDAAGALRHFLAGSQYPVEAVILSNGQPTERIIYRPAGEQAQVEWVCAWVNKKKGNEPIPPPEDERVATMDKLMALNDFVGTVVYAGVWQ